MYRFSRSMYRELSPYISDEPVCLHGEDNHELVLRACEAAVYRLATDRHYFANPARSLFREIRVFFPMAEQHRVYVVVETYLRCARRFLEALPPAGYDVLGNRLGCRATTRKGTPCQRVPLPHNGYCPSHQHLADEEEVPLAA
jgi:hypothetical protein